MFLSKYGVIFNGGKNIFTWNQFFEVINQAGNAKLVDNVKKLIEDRVSYDDNKLFTELDEGKLNKIAMEEFGFKDQTGKSYKVIKKLIYNKLSKFEPKQ